MNLDNLPRKWEESAIHIPRPRDEEAREKYPEMALPEPPPITVPRKLSLFKEMVGEGRFSKLQKGALLLYLFVFPVVFTILAWIFDWGPGGVVLFHALAGGSPPGCSPPPTWCAGAAGWFLTRSCSRR